MGRFEASAEHTLGRITRRRFFGVAGAATGAILLGTFLPQPETVSAQQVNLTGSFYGGKLSNQDPNGGSKTDEERAKQEAKKSRKNDSRDDQAVFSAPERENCAQALTPARNLTTGERKVFPTRCLPPGWEVTGEERKTVQNAVVESPKPESTPRPLFESLRPGSFFSPLR